MTNRIVFPTTSIFVLLGLFYLMILYYYNEPIKMKMALNVAEYGLKLCERCRFNISLEVKMMINNISDLENSSFLEIERKPVTSDRVAILQMKDIKKSVKNVFFLETRCGTRKLVREFNNTFDFILSPRQSCAVESTARTNPTRDIFIMHTCPLSDDFLSRAPKFSKELLRLQNVHVVRINLTELFLGSPVQQLFESGRLENSNWPVVHASDVIRVLVLWKFGGSYFDLDVINIRPLDKLGSNFAGLENSFTVANGVLNFEPSGFGLEVSTTILKHLNESFDGTQWSINGPQLITSMLTKLCSIEGNIKDECNLFTMFHRHIFYPVYYTSLDLLFNAKISKELISWMKARAFSVHFWNKLSRHKTVTVGSNQTYGLLANEFCPSVYRNCGPAF